MTAQQVMDKFMFYNGKVVQPKRVPEAKFRKLQSDASVILNSSAPGTATYLYAKALLGLQPPIAYIMPGAYVQLSDLAFVPKSPSAPYFPYNKRLPDKTLWGSLTACSVRSTGEQVRFVRALSEDVGFVINVINGAALGREVPLSELIIKER